jgi:hypothetical protein
MLGNREVIAVFFKQPNVVSFPPQYKLFAVAPDGRHAEELSYNSESPYWIRGRK